MAQVTFVVGGHSYDLACREGDQARLLRLGELVDARVQEAGRAVGGGNAARQLLMGALLLADELSEVRAGQPDRGQADTAHAIDALAARIEALAERLEKGADGS